jgi:hypothetical protein
MTEFVSPTGRLVFHGVLIRPAIPIFRQSGGQIAEVLTAPKPEVKQNGRSAAYLKHDRTKHRGRPG